MVLLVNSENSRDIFFYKTICRKTAKIVPIYENINNILLFIFPLLLKVYIFASFKLKCFV